jgi:uncharacterized membrane-anchored protein YhcB (DUF1043 family)
MPYSDILNGSKWKSLDISPVAKLIKSRFGPWYTGKLTIYEINSIKEKMDKVKNNLDTYEDEIYNNKCELVDSLRKQRMLCKSSTECTEKLDAHLNTCDGCTKNYVSYDCRFKENGRCSHYYEIEHIEERLEDYQYVIDEYTSSYHDLQYEYERALADKENRLKEYQQQLEDDFDDWSFEVSMRLS